MHPIAPVERPWALHQCARNPSAPRPAVWLNADLHRSPAIGSIVQDPPRWPRFGCVGRVTDLRTPLVSEVVSTRFCFSLPLSCKGEGAGGEGSLEAIRRKETRGSIRSLTLSIGFFARIDRFDGWFAATCAEHCLENGKLIVESPVRHLLKRSDSLA